jgi:hypothetical protein
MFDREEITLKFDRCKLLQALKDNRMKHAHELTQANAEYRKRAEKELNNQLCACRDGDEFNLHFKLTKPESHLDSYDEAISMIEFAQDIQIELNQSQYKKYVLDKWEWQQSFGMTKTMYGIG